MSLLDDNDTESDFEKRERLKQIQQKKLRRQKLKSKNLSHRLEDEGMPVNVEKNFDPIFDRGVITNKTHTWEVELPTEHIGNEQDGSLCGRSRTGGNIYVTPSQATCKRCVNIYNRSRKKNRKIPPIRQNVQPKPKIEENINYSNNNSINEIFKTALCAWLVGIPTNIKIRGSREQMKALTDALTATKAFHNEMKKNKVQLEQVTTKLAIKTAVSQKFKQVFGIDWPL